VGLQGLLKWHVPRRHLPCMPRHRAQVGLGGARNVTNLKQPALQVMLSLCAAVCVSRPMSHC
jgi:hypothetical protein